MSRKENKRGYVLLYSVILLGMVVLAMALYLSWLGVFSLQNKKASYNSKIAQNLAETCAEKALMAIWNDENASGDTHNNLFGGSGDCSYTVSGSGETRTIQASGEFKNITRKTKVEIDQISTDISIISWREVADF